MAESDQLISFRLPARKMQVAERRAAASKVALSKWARAVVIEALADAEPADPGYARGYSMAMATVAGWVERNEVASKSRFLARLESAAMEGHAQEELSPGDIIKMPVVYVRNPEPTKQAAVGTEQKQAIDKMRAPEGAGQAPTQAEAPTPPQPAEASAPVSVADAAIQYVAAAAGVDAELVERLAPRKPHTWAEQWEAFKSMEREARMELFAELQDGRDLDPEFGRMNEADKIEWLSENWPLGA